VRPSRPVAFPRSPTQYLVTSPSYEASHYVSVSVDPPSPRTLITTCFSPCDTEHHTITQQDPPGIAESRSRAGDQSAWRAGTDCGGWRPLQAPVAPAPPSHRIAPFWDACETQDPLQERLKCDTRDVTLSFPCAQAPRRGRGGREDEAPRILLRQCIEFSHQSHASADRDSGVWKGPRAVF
jgi:hypothetical protein